MHKKIRGSIDFAKGMAAGQLRKHRGKLIEHLDKEAPQSLDSWCSWCGEYASHRLIAESRLARPVYQCQQCLLPTLPCRFCDNMARGAGLNTEIVPEEGGKKQRVAGFIRDNWHHQLCAEHDGSISDFSRAHERIAELGDFRALMQPRQRNLYHLGRKAGMAAGGAVIVGTGAWLAAPGIAAAIGSSGALGAAKTGAGIAALKGAALGSASAVRVGTTGMALIALTGAGLGGRTGFGLANAYLKAIPDYDFIQLRAPAEGNNHRVVVVNGFLTEKDRTAQDWLQSLDGQFSGSGVWYLNWEAKTLLKLGMMSQSLISQSTGVKLARTAARMATRKMARRVTLAGGALAAAQLADNPWHSAMVNAQKAGALLAEAISRTDGTSYTLIGHSLGARVVFFALLALAEKKAQYVDDAIMLGAAVGRSKQADWDTAAQAVSGGLYNCYSCHDGVLRFLYQGANLGISRPAGLGEAAGACDNRDFSELVAGHTCWIENLAVILDSLECECC